ncbi:hypothetical protein [Anoxybacteroides tepidamans]|uniref:hypothetical protein n=1 Tax=Anoxybacteroides tepidamans TaxID=265948 RepID=UPI0018DBC4B6|nr:hypothetical protein [Anoxybacillus tepidamans]
MKAKQAEDIVLLKQKIIYLQSELARYKSKYGDWSLIQAENERLKEALERTESQVRELTKQLEEIAAENILLKELALQSEQRYEELTKVKKEKEELERQLAQLKTYATDEGDESWFFHTLRQQNAIIKGEQSTTSNSSNPPLSSEEDSKEK